MTITPQIPFDEITRNEAIELLKEHGWNPAQPTAVDTTEPKVYNSIGDQCYPWMPGTSFYDEMGIHDTYQMADVKRWLGY